MFYDWAVGSMRHTRLQTAGITANGGEGDHAQIMPLEIERKFLVAGDAWRRDGGAGVWIRQGYLTNARPLSVRVRIEDPGKATLTLKLPRNNVSRLEYEYEIPRDEAEELLELCQDAMVTKRRYDIRYDGDLWQVDVFEGDNQGLIVAEIELAREDQEFARPGWLGREVTDEQRFQNSLLAQTPYSTWSAGEGAPAPLS